jgi:hypothetical protein
MASEGSMGGDLGSEGRQGRASTNAATLSLACTPGVPPNGEVATLGTYLKAVWPDFGGGALLRSSRAWGPGKALKKVGGEAPRRFEGFPGPLGPARPQKRNQKNGQTAFKCPAKTKGNL